MYERLTGRENVGLIGKMHKLPKTELRRRTEALLEKMELLERADEQVRNYSGGMKRRLDIIMSLVHNPQILFLDEPTLGLDPAARHVVWDFIEELKKEKKTIILTTHYMDEADVLCDQVAVIDYGKIIAEDTPEQLKEKVGAGDIIEIDFTGDAASAIKSLERFKFVRKVSKIQGHLVIVAEAGITRLGEITNTLHNCGGSVGKIAVRQNTLEDVFIHLTGRRLGE
jgi:ABC-2 type transport system ATP-binding protein